jgi:hypothetical protein
MTSPSGGCGTGSGPWLIQGEQADTIVTLDHIETNDDITGPNDPARAACEFKPLALATPAGTGPNRVSTP